ncbi:hypothetical protein BH09SUM1_BH09SUM1_03240 [soil metagenome]
MKRIAIALLLLSTMQLSGCLGKLFGINLTVVGEKTALEKQVLGTYQEIGRDLASYASVRGVNEDGTLKPSPEVTDSQRAVLQALNDRQYNRDDLQTMLRAGVLGEANTGLVVILRDPAPGDEIPPKLAQEVFTEENADRATVLGRLMQTTPGVTEKDRAQVEWIFTTLNEDLAPAGSRVQDQSGAWRTK